jgi:hypothetical protein
MGEELPDMARVASDKIGKLNSAEIIGKVIDVAAGC